MKSPIPVTLITGFLGAGKTTLVQHLLENSTGRRFAIIENEFGDVGIDGTLVSRGEDAVFELNDGCVCCTVREDLVEVFEQIDAGEETFDHVLIETTGLAEPGPVMSIFDRPALRQAFTLDGVICVVDAGHLEQSLDEVSACAEQVAYADLLILNKVDGRTALGLDETEARLRRLNPLAEIVRAEHARVDVESVLALVRRPAEESVGTPHDHGHGHDHNHHHHHHHDEDHHEHDDDIGAVVVEAAGDVHVDALDLWLGKLARGHDPVLLRMKGILAVPGHARRFVFNGVRTVVDVRPDRAWGTDARYSRVVLIGKSLDAETLQAGFASCMVDAHASANVP